MAQLTHRSLLKMNQVVHPRSPGIGPGCPDNVPVNVIALDVCLHIRPHQALGLIRRLIPVFPLYQVPPFLRQEGTVHARSHTRRHHGRLDGKCAASAEGVHQNPVLIPRCQKKQRRRQGFRDGGLAGKRAVAPFVEGIPAGINAHRYHVLIEKYPQGEAQPIFWKPAHLVAAFQTLHHRFFHDGLNIRRAEQPALNRGGLGHPEFPVLRDKFLPGEGLRALKQLLKGLCPKASRL